MPAYYPLLQFYWPASLGLPFFFFNPASRFRCLFSTRIGLLPYLSTCPPLPSSPLRRVLAIAGALCSLPAVSKVVRCVLPVAYLSVLSCVRGQRKGRLLSHPGFHRAPRPTFVFVGVCLVWQYVH